MIALNPDLRAFVEARLSHMPFAGIEAEVVVRVPSDRRTSLSAIRLWW